jgi:HTH-type transcriptional regulator/antitoxin HigA
VFAQAQQDALESEREVLADQLKEYEALKSGTITDFTTDSLHELPDLLVKARIAKGISQRQLAQRLGIKEQQVQRYEAERYGRASLRRLLEIADALDLQVRKHAHVERDAKAAVTERRVAFDWTRFPLKEMYRRGWFTGFIGSEEEAERNAESLLTSFLSIASVRAVSAFHRKHVRSGSTLDDYALFAWECRVRWLAQEMPLLATFSASQLTAEWARNLAQQSAVDDGPTRVKSYLRDCGIMLVVEPYMPKTYLDGAALFLADKGPIVAMTLRYDRLDNFWFVLLHEIAHLCLHFRSGDFEPFFDDLDAGPDRLEAEADRFASEALVPGQIWETSIARYARSRPAIESLARQLHVSPAVVAGRIRREAKNYVILNEMVGLGEVRRQFPEVTFGK